MATVIVERMFNRPRSLAELGGMMRSTEWCMAQHSVVALRHYFGADGRRLVCVFDAPDSEAVRSAIRTGGLSAPTRIWTASVHGEAGRGRDDIPEQVDATVVLVERTFPQPVDFDDVQALEDASGLCFDLRGVVFLRSYFAMDRRRMICLYTAPDAEAVREANLAGRLPFDLVWPATVLVEQPSARRDRVPDA